MLITGPIIMSKKKHKKLIFSVVISISISLDLILTQLTPLISPTQTWKIPRTNDEHTNLLKYEPKTITNHNNITLTMMKIHVSRSSSRWDFHFHSYVLMICIRLYWILELVVFYSLVRRGCIRKVSVQLVHKYFSRVCSTDSFSCSEQKNWKKTRLKQGRKT